VTDYYLDNVLRERRDDVARTYTSWDENGTQTEQRPYTAEENAEADARVQRQMVATATAELERASLLNSAPEELAALQTAILAQEGIHPGDPWRQPTGTHDAYPLGALVSHKDEDWESTVAANVWEPGVSGWKTVGVGPQPWIQPTGGHDAYAAGAIVTHVDKVWSSDVDANVWEPGVYGWTEV